MCSKNIRLLAVVAVILICSVRNTMNNEVQENANNMNGRNIIVDSISPFCWSPDDQKLICNYNSTNKPVFLEVPSRHKRSAESSFYKSVEIRSASVFHLAESACLEAISIHDTKRVIVDNSYEQKTETGFCAEYQLSLLNSTITNIPITVTSLDVVRSTIENLFTPPPLARASVLHSKVGVFSTRVPLNGSSVVNISFTIIREVQELKMKDRAQIIISSSNLTFTNPDGLSFENNVSVVISKSSLSPQTAQLIIGPDVKVTLNEVKGEVKIKVLPSYAENSKNADIQEPSEVKANKLFFEEHDHTCSNNLIYLYIILAAGVGIMLTLVGQKVWHRIQHKESVAKHEQTQDALKESANGKLISSGSSDNEIGILISPDKTPKESLFINHSIGSTLKKRTPAAKKQLYVQR